MPSAINGTNGSGSDASNIVGGHAKSQTRCHKPMVNSGSLDKFSQRDLTPIIGREFEGLQVKDLLKADGQLIKDLAITSQTKTTRKLQVEIANMTQFRSEGLFSYEIKM